MTFDSLFATSKFSSHFWSWVPLRHFSHDTCNIIALLCRKIGMQTHFAVILIIATTTEAVSALQPQLLAGAVSLPRGGKLPEVNSAL